jgi:hypothetical protein
MESVFSMLVGFNGGGELRIQPVEPISFELSEAALLQIAPKEWLLEKAGIDMTLYGPQPGAVVPGEQLAVNENIKNLTGRQHQQLLRIIRQFGQGKITREVAVTLIKTGLGLMDSDINTLLGVDEEFSEDDDLSIFEEYGLPRDNFQIHLSRAYKFAEGNDDIDTKILEILNRQPLTPPEDIAKALKIKVAEVNTRLIRLVDLNVIEYNPKTKERRLKQPIKKVVDTPSATAFEIRYSYEWKSSVPASERDTAEHPSRPFCKKIISLDRFWSRTEIEKISQRLGYSVFDRGGGWWSKSPSCRHQWVSNIVVKKKK